ncbi:hypothetical protein FACS1894110_15220 [Spirochaetia bacterium]|nr:hypothetical protein FACS1894110_15220 [Spirochaetia bacterium]
MCKEFTTLIIVDDDDAIRESLKENIDWASLGYQVVGVAEDGISGIELAEEYEPDIIISDVLMPCMDGLTMLKELQDRGHHPRIIILSGHDEFEYARTAISLSVDAYINKPLDKKIFIETLNHTKERLENEHRFLAQIKNSLPLLRQAFFSKLFSGYYQRLEAIKEQADFLELEFREGPFLCVAAALDPLSPEIIKRGIPGKEFIKAAVIKLAEDMLHGYCSVFFYDLGEISFVLLLELNEKNLPENKTAVLQQLEELIPGARSRYKVPLTLGLSGFHRDISNISIAYQEALKALSCGHLFGTGRLISIQDINMNDNKGSWEMQQVARELAMAVRFADASLVNEQLSRFQQQVRAAIDVPMIRIKMDASAIAFALVNEADSWLKEGKTEVHDAFNETYNKIQSLGTIDDILKALNNLAITIINLIEDTRLFHHQTILHKALAYLETNYQNKELSLAAVARAAGVSQSHLSFLFKKKINSSFHKYLTKIRIEHAIKLLKENDFKTYEVADMVGYSNAQYFSASFKKYTGSPPLQYRNESG